MRGSGRFRDYSYFVIGRSIRVSIPFIAGQWSLPLTKLTRTSRPNSFNPLHCGAVVASLILCCLLRVTRVSIPFIAGQWSLPINVILLIGIILFQSPSLRGSGRFVMPTTLGSLVVLSFNPLHCGAVVASSYSGKDHFYWALVSIPFIAGQWSLQGVISNETSPGKDCFNPLHCGAVVASAGNAAGNPSGHTCFNPLHCGAVVASRREKMDLLFSLVSIPFIAGQWSLRGAGVYQVTYQVMFQSPSLRGSGRFTT